MLPYVCGMKTAPFQPLDKVKLRASILEDGTRKASHFLYERIIQEERIGEVVSYESSELHQGIWVQFHYGKILVEEDQIGLI
jgi:hypothetical protein